MSDRLTDQIGSLVRRLSRNLNAKISQILMILFNHKNVGSIGAIAGFAIAVVFTWKFLRPISPPGGPRRNRPKRGSSTPAISGGSRANEAGSSSGAHERGLNLDDSEEVEEIGSPVELTIRQIVRRKLGGCRKMTCQLLGVVLEERAPEELQKHATVRLSVVEVLLHISKFCDLYLMERILDDESEERVLLALESAGLFQSGGLVKDKVLFCSTETGRTSFVRQLEADWHVETNPEIVNQLSRFIRSQLYISPEASSGITATNVFTSTSLEQYFLSP